MFSFYRVDAAVPYTNNADIAAEQFILADADDVRQTIDRWLARHGRKLLEELRYPDPDGTETTELCVTAWRNGRWDDNIDLRPHVVATAPNDPESSVRIDWAEVTIWPLAGDRPSLGQPVRVAGGVWRYGHAHSSDY